MHSNRTTRGRPLHLTERDFEIFRRICSDGAQTSAAIEKRFWDGKSRRAKAAFQRIRKLVEAGFLEHGDPRLLYLSDCARNLILDGASGRAEGVVAGAQGQ